MYLCQKWSKSDRLGGVDGLATPRRVRKGSRRLARRGKAAEGRRPPRRFARAGMLAHAPASWRAPAPWRFGLLPWPAALKQVAERRAKIARSFNCGWSGPKPNKPQRGGRRMAKDSAAPPGLGFIWRAKPAVETAGYCQPRRWRRWGWPVSPTRPAGKGSRWPAALCIPAAIGLIKDLVRSKVDAVNSVNG